MLTLTLITHIKRHDVFYICGSIYRFIKYAYVIEWGRKLKYFCANHLKYHIWINTVLTVSCYNVKSSLAMIQFLIFVIFVSKDDSNFMLVFYYKEGRSRSYVHHSVVMDCLCVV